MGLFDTRPISNLRCSPICLIRLITHLSYPPANSVNDFIDEHYTSVKYSSFHNAISMVQILGKNAELGKMDLKSTFRLLPVYHGDFDLLGFKIEEKFTLTNLCLWDVLYHVPLLKDFQHFCIG